MDEKKHQIWAIVLAVLLSILLMAGIGAGFVLREVNQMKQNAVEMKADLHGLTQCLLRQDMDGAQQKLDRVCALSASVQTSLNKPLWKFGARFAPTEYAAVRQLLPLFDRAAEELLQPLIHQLRLTPLTKLKEENGIHSEQLTQLITFARQMVPTAEKLVGELKEIPLGRLDQNGKVFRLTEGMQEAFELLDDDTLTLMTAFTEQLEQYPLDHIRTGLGVNVTLAANYLGFIRKMLPQLEQLMEKLENHRGSVLLQNELAAEYCEKAEKLLTLYRENQDLAQLAEVLLAGEEDRYFLIPALNATETRAIGGFPGAIGALTIRDGILELEGFFPVRAMLNPAFPSSVTIPNEERRFFHSPLSDPQLCWDACHCPDFEWVARIWAASHEERIHHQVDGVIALSPTVIQQLLAITGQIKLSDGTILNGENATRMLEYELYFRYFQKNNSSLLGNEMTDALFAETARKTMNALVENLKAEKLPALLTVARETLNSRKAMVWMKDEAAQQVVRELGFSGGLDRNPEEAELGLYFNCTSASKMGWFAELQTQIGLPEVQEDGSAVYPVTLTLSNSITQEEINRAGLYILGSGDGRLYCAMYLFAPRDADIRNVTIGGQGYTEYAAYQGLKAANVKNLSIAPGKAVEIRFELVTPQDFDRPLVISQTPLLQDYH